MKNLKKSLRWWHIPLAALVVWYGSEIMIAAVFGFPNNPDEGMILVKKYNNAIMCRVLWKPPQILPGTTEGDDQDWCFNLSANYFKDVKYCNYIENDWLKGRCQSGRIPCGDIEDDSARYTCFREQAESGKIKIDDCLAENDHFNKAECLYGLALGSNNEKFCDAIPIVEYNGNGRKFFCYRAIADITDNIELCEKITHEEGKELCIRGVLDD